jgi:hypothetical protein
MLQDKATSRENYDRFVERVKQSREVWGLKSQKGWAQCPSNEQQDRHVLVFWSDRAYAARHVKDDWSEYEPEAIPLASFLTRWLPGMQKDGAFVGPNWDAHLCGLEVQPQEVARRLKE